MKATIKDLEEQLKNKEAALQATEAAKIHAVEAAKYQIREVMQSKIDEAYDKGYQRSKETLEQSMRLMKEMQGSGP